MPAITWARRAAAVAALPGLALLAAIPASAAPAPQPRPDEWWFSTWAIQQKVWPLSEGSGVTVAVLDTGVQADVPDLAGVVIPGANVTGGGGDGRTDFDTKEDGHGTAMSVLIAGQGRGTGMAGIAPSAHIMPVAVTRVGGAAAAVADSAGIRFAVDHGAKVINMSIASPGYPPPACDTSVQEAVAYAVEHNVVVVAAAGNYGNLPTDYPQWPASCAGVLAVGGIEPNGAPWAETERQSYVDIAAPGDHVGWSARDGKYFPDGFGTSQATALVSGAAALIRSRYPSMTARQVVQRLINTTVPLGHPVPNDVTGYGLIDIHRALDPNAFPVPASAPNPPYAAFDRWRASSQGRQAGTTAGPPPSAAHTSAGGAAPSSGSGTAVLATIVAVIVVVLATTVAFFAVRRGRRKNPPGPPYPGQQQYPGQQRYPGPPQYPGQAQYPGAGPYPGAAPPGYGPGAYPSAPPPGYGPGAYPSAPPPGYEPGPHPGAPPPPGYGSPPSPHGQPGYGPHDHGGPRP